MFKAILCDDNEIILEGLVSQIKWEECGVSLVGTAIDGKEAMSLMQVNIPDILITDIRMPLMDGLELIKKAKELNNNLVAIIISGYDDFEYARGAVKLGAIDYILKPISPMDLVKALNKAVEHCRQISHGQYISKLEIIRDIFYGDVSMKSLSNRCINSNFNPAIYCCVMRIELNESSALINNSQLNNEIRFSQLIDKLSHDRLFIVERDLTKCTILLCEDEKKQLLDSQNNIIKTVRNVFNPENKDQDVVIALGNIYKGIYNGVISLEECNKALKLHYIKGPNSTIMYCEVEEYSEVYNSRHGYEDVLDIDFLTPIINHDFEVIDERINVLKNRLKEKGKDSYLYMTLEIGGLYTELIRKIKEAGIGISSTLTDSIKEFKKIIESGTLDMAVETLRDSLYKVSNNIHNNKNKHNNIVNKSIQYIKSHYGKSSLSINDVATAISMSSSYFSTIFKNETGLNFTDYLIKIRMDKAIKLLPNTNLKIYEIATKVGYDNPSYFSVAFKRHTGLSPSEYQSLHVDN